jgi:hypothetical protein
MWTSSHLGDCEAAVAWGPSGRAETRLVHRPRRRPRAPACRRDRHPKRSVLDGSPHVRDIIHRARAPPSRRPPRQAPCQRSAAQLGEAGFHTFPHAERKGVRPSPDLKPARHASACWLLLASDACLRRAASRASRPAALWTPARRPERAGMGTLSAGHVPLATGPWLTRAWSREAHSVPLSFLCRRCLLPRAMVPRATQGGPSRGRADDAGGGAAGSVGSGGIDQQQAGFAELLWLAAIRVAEQAGAVAVAVVRRDAAERFDSEERFDAQAALWYRHEVAQRHPLSLPPRGRRPYRGRRHRAVRCAISPALNHTLSHAVPPSPKLNG